MTSKIKLFALAQEVLNKWLVPYITVSNSGELSQERALTAGSGIELTDGGANSSLTIGVTASMEKYAILSAAAFKLGPTAPTTAIEGTFPVLQFSNTRTETSNMLWHIPPDWEVGTDVEVAFYWSPTSAGTGTVAWEFEWEAVQANSNEILGAGSTHVDIHDQAEGLDNELLETGYGDISGASLSADDTIGFQILRDHDDAADDYGAPAALVHVEIEYISDRLGIPK